MNKIIGKMMNIIPRFRKTTLIPVDNRGGWFPWIREPYSGSWQAGVVDWTVDTVLAYQAVYACITLIATDIGKLPFTLVRKGQDEIWSRFEDKEIWPVLKKPNHYQNHIQFKEWWVTSRLVRGNTYVLKERDTGGKVRKLHILDPSRVHVLVADDGSVFYQLGRDPLNGQQQTSVTVPASEIIHDRINCLFHPLVGVSPLFASGQAATQGLKIEQDSTKFFENGANPSGVLTAPGAISNETAARLKEYWESNYTGENSGKIAVMGDGLKFEVMRMTAVDAQLIEQLKWTAEVVCSTFHVPAYKVGVGPAPTYNNIEALTQDYYSQCLQTHIESMELCLDEGLEVQDGMGTELDLDVLFRMDSSTLIKTLKEGVSGCIYAPNEARRRMNLKPVKGGDTVYMQQQNWSLEQLDRRDIIQDKPGNAPPPAASDKDDDDEDVTDKFLEFMNKKEAESLHAH